MGDAFLWYTRFSELVDGLSEHWKQGRVTTAPGSNGRPRFEVKTFTHGYPVFVGDMAGRQVHVTIHEFSDELTSHLKPGDRMECLRLSVRLKIDRFVLLRSVKWFDRLSEYINKSQVTNTGNMRIDERYRTEAREGEDRRLVSSAGFHRVVERLEPFAFLTVSDNGCHVSIPIQSVEQLSLQPVLAGLDSLFVLSELVSPNGGRV